MTRTDSLYEHTIAVLIGVLFAAAAFHLGLGCTPAVTPLPDAGDGGNWALTCAKIRSQPGFIRNADGTPYMPNCDAEAP